MLLFPNAKINIGLNILDKRPDGFHNLESLLYPIGLSDILDVVTIENSKGHNFTQTGINLNIDKENNLCNKALGLLSDDFDLPGIDMHLHKIIPFGAGLGGGSSDSVFVLKAINELCSLGISNESLMNYSAKLGSDCPFFVNNSPTFVTGRGDILEKSKIKLSGYFLALIVPRQSVNTAYAYSLVKPEPWKISLRDILDGSINEWKKLLRNDFEEEICRAYPEIGIIKKKLYGIGAIYASMSGSGSAVYGIFENMPETGNNFGKSLVFSQQL